MYQKYKAFFNSRLSYGLLFIIIAVSFMSCSSSDYNSTSKNNKQADDTQSPKAHSTISEFNFNSDKITIKVLNERGTYNTHVITESDIVDNIVNMCKSYDYQKVDSNDLLDGLCEIFIIFNKDTVIGMYKNQDYGNIEHEIKNVGTPVWLPVGLNKYISTLLKNTSKVK